MYKFKSIICLIFITSTFVTAQERVDFSGKTVVIKGWAKNLAIVGHSEGYIEISEVQQKDEKGYSYKVSGDTLTLSLVPSCHTISVQLPKSVNLKTEMADVVYETKFDPFKGADWRALTINNIDGNVESKTDGYNVALHKVSGSISIVTYGNISAILPDLSNSELVSLDTYWGNVYAKIPDEISANITLTANAGKVEIPRGVKFEKRTKTKKKFKGTLKDGVLPILLHSERGKEVELDSH